MQTIEKLMQHVAPCPMSGCWIWLGCVKEITPNYLQPRIRVEGKTISGAKVFWELQNGKVPEGLCVLHTCHNSLCVAPHHLYLGTHQKNMQDMKDSYRTNGGNGASGLEGVQAIFNMRNAGMKNTEIAKIVGLHWKSVSRIFNGGRYKSFAEGRG